VSAQFGVLNFDGLPSSQGYIEKANRFLVRFGPDKSDFYSADGITILYQAFYTTKEAEREKQPLVAESGLVITWDGRLDNRESLIGQLRAGLSPQSPDVSIVGAAYERWGTSCFAKLIGDWALSICNPKEQSVILAKDFVGLRQLYYSLERDQVSWSTTLDPLVLLSSHSFLLNEEYIAGWFSFFPKADLTPYNGIDSVPPSSFVEFRPGRQRTTKYWDFNPSREIRYRSDDQYEEHFRAAFAESVKRRLRANAPVLAELSGGMDSSSIVCMADTIIAHEHVDAPRLDTVSYFDDSEPNWNERPYFTKVEEKRGGTGCHIDASSQGPLEFELDGEQFAATPGAGGSPTETTRQFAACMTEGRNRVILSGIGGDEVTGGVPTPTPELADLIARAKFRRLAHQLKVWALNKRKPWFYLLFDAAREFFPPRFFGIPQHLQPAPWLRREFVQRNRAALTGYPKRVKFLGGLPSFQENFSTLNALRRQLACSPLSCNPVSEKRYPYLDRDLLEFLFAVPREQLVRPGQRRSLMRRALVGIVPDEILNRKRKAFVARGPLVALSADRPALARFVGHMVSDSLGIVKASQFGDALQRACEGQEMAIVPLMRTLGVEMWVRAASDAGVLHRPEGLVSQIKGSDSAAWSKTAPLTSKSSAS
jgi:asparagine synthase (glutamine-hydrolysing)